MRLACCDDGTIIVSDAGSSIGGGVEDSVVNGFCWTGVILAFSAHAMNNANGISMPVATQTLGAGCIEHVGIIRFNYRNSSGVINNNTGGANCPLF